MSDAFPSPLPLFAFDGDTYNSKRDHKRLKRQLDSVHELMRDGQWRSLRTIADLCGGSEASISARLRDLRKVKYGGLTVERRHAVGGIWEYRVTP
jgi:hypothetical protein